MNWPWLSLVLALIGTAVYITGSTVLLYIFTAAAVLIIVSHFRHQTRPPPPQTPS